MIEQDEIARQELLDQQKALRLERLFIQKFRDLWEHLGCDPAELEELDLVELVEAAKLADDSLERMRAALWDSHYGRGIAKEYAQSRTAHASNAQAHLRQALASLPEKKEG